MCRNVHFGSRVNDITLQCNVYFVAASPSCRGNELSLFDSHAQSDPLVIDFDRGYEQMRLT